MAMLISEGLRRRWRLSLFYGVAVLILLGALLAPLALPVAWLAQRIKRRVGRASAALRASAFRDEGRGRRGTR